MVGKEFYNKTATARNLWQSFALFIYSIVRCQGMCLRGYTLSGNSIAAQLFLCLEFLWAAVSVPQQMLALSSCYRAAFLCNIQICTYAHKGRHAGQTQSRSDVDSGVLHSKRWLHRSSHLCLVLNRLWTACYISSERSYSDILEPRRRDLSSPWTQGVVFPTDAAMKMEALI